MVERGLISIHPSIHIPKSTLHNPDRSSYCETLGHECTPPAAEKVGVWVGERPDGVSFYPFGIPDLFVLRLVGNVRMPLNVLTQ